MVVKLKMVVMEKKQKGDGGEDGSFVVVMMEFIECGEVVAEICCGVVAGVIAGGEGLGP